MRGVKEKQKVYVFPSKLGGFAEKKKQNLHQEGGSVSRQTISRVLTTSVTSRHRSVIFKMAGKFLVRYFQKMWNFLRFG